MAFVRLSLILFCAFGSCILSAHSSVFRQGRFKNGLIRPPATDRKLEVPPDMWFEQRLDHFNPQDLRTWLQRYFVNDTFYKPGGPVFLQIGGEGTADPIWMLVGSWVEYAKTYNALLIQVEHRYYGKSHPVSNLSTPNMKYLSSEQALEDLANFITVYSAMQSLEEAKWIAFGGSYPGSLATWIRLKYPHLIHGSVATSAPLVATADFSDYLRVVRDSLDTTKYTDCVPNIQKATDMVGNLLKDGDGRLLLKQMFKLCDNIDVSKANDVANLYSVLSGNFEGVVQYNRDNRAFEGATGTNITIDTLCGIMTSSSGMSPLQSYAAVNDLIMRTYNQTCQSVSYKTMIAGMQNTSWEASASEGGRQWTYQTCTEFGYYQTSNYKDQPFGQFFPLKFWTQQCADIFGASINEKVLYSSINFTNANYGGLDVQVTRIIFPNGSIDPWHALGVTKDLSPDAKALFINGTAHCANMYPESEDDLPQLREARATISKSIGAWLLVPK